MLSQSVNMPYAQEAVVGTTWKTAISPSKSSSDGLLLVSSSSWEGAEPGGRRKSQSDTPITPSRVASGAGAVSCCWLWEEL